MYYFCMILRRTLKVNNKKGEIYILAGVHRYIAIGKKGRFPVKTSLAGCRYIVHIILLDTLPYLSYTMLVGDIERKSIL